MVDVSNGNFPAKTLGALWLVEAVTWIMVVWVTWVWVIESRCTVAWVAVDKTHQTHNLGAPNTVSTIVKKHDKNTTSWHPSKGKYKQCNSKLTILCGELKP